jgi:protein-S-isoprenylcysteine O-methyltransferase Ste14
MAVAALILCALLALLMIGVRVAVQIRRTGSTGWHRYSGTPGSTEWWGGFLFQFGFALGPLAPLLDLLGVLEPIPALDHAATNLAGLVLCCVGVVGVFLAQLAMGDAWRVGVDPEARTELVVSGPFALVRNPIYALMIPFGIGLALMVPNVLAFVDLAIVMLGLELVVRRVEEPYLLRVHGDAYREYAARVGRFLPGVGRLGPSH